jgi:hypothetical protein
MTVSHPMAGFVYCFSLISHLCQIGPTEATAHIWLLPLSGVEFDIRIDLLNLEDMHIGDPQNRQWRKLMKKTVSESPNDAT